MNSNLKRIIISPPFGTYIHLKNATSVKGSITFARRPGKWKQILKTVRRIRNGWINQIGLRNNGLYNTGRDFFNNKNNLYSFAAVDSDTDWLQILELLINMDVTDIMVELNLSCPNTQQWPISEFLLKRYAETFPLVSIKFPPDLYASNGLILKQAYNAGIKVFHFSNTLHTPHGGISGPYIKPFSLNNIQMFKPVYPDATFIGGGGIYSRQDVRDYKNAGADCFSLGTVWFTPCRVPAVINEINKLE